MSDNKQSSSKLQDISLTAEEQKNTPLEDSRSIILKKEMSVVTDKQISKTNSLKRFFKLNYKKIESSSNANIEKNETSKTDKKIFECLPDEPKRFHLRLGSRQKHLDSAETDEVPSSSTTSKLTLKRSINKYWQTLFKGPKSGPIDGIEDTDNVPNLILKKSFIEENKGEESSDDNEEEIVETNAENFKPTSDLPDTVDVSYGSTENFTEATFTESKEIKNIEIEQNMDNIKDSIGNTQPFSHED